MRKTMKDTVDYDRNRRFQKVKVTGPETIFKAPSRAWRKAQWLRVHSALTEGPSSVPSAHIK